MIETDENDSKSIDKILEPFRDQIQAQGISECEFAKFVEDIRTTVDEAEPGKSPRVTVKAKEPSLF